ncbi:MAG TPA: hypothetical protein VLC10_04085, partial [Patescibacteria group bacterium]|nr:hypothetical protein [Patescibacteria group bacterium]
MRRLLPPIALLAALVAFSATIFAYRGDLRDAYHRWQRGPVPPAVTRQDALRDNGNAVRAVTAPSAPDENSATDAASAAPKTEAAPPAAPARPASYNLKVIFVPQAPFKVWDALHEDTCEEASMLMLKAYVDGTDDMT